MSKHERGEVPFRRSLQAQVLIGALLGLATMLAAVLAGFHAYGCDLLMARERRLAISVSQRLAGEMGQQPALGIGRSADGFGTGHSPLAYLKRFPVQKLKIDKSFVRGVSADGESATICRSVIELGHKLGLKLVAGAWRPNRTSHSCANRAATMSRAIFSACPCRWPSR